MALKRRAQEKSRAAEKAEPREKHKSLKFYINNMSVDAAGGCGDGYEERTETPNYTATALINRIQKKRLELMEQLMDHFEGRQLLNDNDIIRYSAMIEVLKAVLQ